jgi:carbamoyl-phosphate synthase/aspartate carbamoyltransferase/dihydroorotase
MSPTTLRNEQTFSKVGWTAFDGLEVAGYVKRVVLRGQLVYENGRVLAQPGNGRLL